MPGMTPETPLKKKMTHQRNARDLNVESPEAELEARLLRLEALQKRMQERLFQLEATHSEHAGPLQHEGQLLKVPHQNTECTKTVPLVNSNACYSTGNSTEKYPTKYEMSVSPSGDFPYRKQRINSPKNRISSKSNTPAPSSARTDSRPEPQLCSYFDGIARSSKPVGSYADHALKPKKKIISSVGPGSTRMLPASTHEDPSLKPGTSVYEPEEFISMPIPPVTTTPMAVKPDRLFENTSSPSLLHDISINNQITERIENVDSSEVGLLNSENDRISETFQQVTLDITPEHEIIDSFSDNYPVGSQRRVSNVSNTSKVSFNEENLKELGLEEDDNRTNINKRAISLEIHPKKLLQMKRLSLDEEAIFKAPSLKRTRESKKGLLRVRPKEESKENMPNGVRVHKKLKEKLREKKAHSRELSNIKVVKRPAPKVEHRTEHGSVGVRKSSKSNVDTAAGTPRKVKVRDTNSELNSEICTCSDDEGDTTIYCSVPRKQHIRDREEYYPFPYETQNKMYQNQNALQRSQELGRPVFQGNDIFEYADTSNVRTAVLEDWQEPFVCEAQKQINRSMNISGAEDSMYSNHQREAAQGYVNFTPVERIAMIGESYYNILPLSDRLMHEQAESQQGILHQTPICSNFPYVAEENLRIPYVFGQDEGDITTTTNVGDYKLDFDILHRKQQVPLELSECRAINSSQPTKHTERNIFQNNVDQSNITDHHEAYKDFANQSMNQEVRLHDLEFYTKSTENIAEFDENHREPLPFRVLPSPALSDCFCHVCSPDMTGEICPMMEKTDLSDFRTFLKDSLDSLSICFCVETSKESEILEISSPVKSPTTHIESSIINLKDNIERETPSTVEETYDLKTDVPDLTDDVQLLQGRETNQGLEIIESPTNLSKNTIVSFNNNIERETPSTVEETYDFEMDVPEETDNMQLLQGRETNQGLEIIEHPQLIGAEELKETSIDRRPQERRGRLVPENLKPKTSSKEKVSVIENDLQTDEERDSPVPQITEISQINKQRGDTRDRSSVNSFVNKMITQITEKVHPMKEFSQESETYSQNEITDIKIPLREDMQKTPELAVSGLDKFDAKKLEFDQQTTKNERVIPFKEDVSGGKDIKDIKLRDENTDEKFIEVENVEDEEDPTHIKNIPSEGSIASSKIFDDSKKFSIEDVRDVESATQQEKNITESPQLNTIEKRASSPNAALSSRTPGISVLEKEDDLRHSGTIRTQVSDFKPTRIETNVSEGVQVNTEGAVDNVDHETQVEKNTEERGVSTSTDVSAHYIGPRREVGAFKGSRTTDLDNNERKRGFSSITSGPTVPFLSESHFSGSGTGTERYRGKDVPSRVANASGGSGGEHRTLCAEVGCGPSAPYCPLNPISTRPDATRQNASKINNNLAGGVETNFGPCRCETCCPTTSLASIDGEPSVTLEDKCCNTEQDKATPLPLVRVNYNPNSKELFYESYERNETCCRAKARRPEDYPARYQYSDATNMNADPCCTPKQTTSSSVYPSRADNRRESGGKNRKSRQGKISRAQEYMYDNTFVMGPPSLPRVSHPSTAASTRRPTSKMRQQHLSTPEDAFCNCSKDSKNRAGALLWPSVPDSSGLVSPNSDGNNNYFQTATHSIEPHPNTSCSRKRSKSISREKQRSVYETAGIAHPCYHAPRSRSESIDCWYEPKYSQNKQSGRKRSRSSSTHRKKAWEH